MTLQRFWMVWQFARRDIVARVRGSALGLAWLLLTPLAFLAAYVFVFVYVLKSRWPGVAHASGAAESALAIYAGLIVHGLIAECAVRAPGLVREQPHLVTKVAFPLEWLPVSALASALIQTFANILVLIIGVAWVRGTLDASLFLIPVALVPLAIATLALAWLLAALGVFVRDIAQAIGPLVALLLFFSPVFWPIEALPADVRSFFVANPLTLPIGWMRAAALGLGSIDWSAWWLYLAGAVAFAVAARAFFLRLNPGFADEL
ncbi:MAG: ABC transporter permease [Gemmatimonadota bacterium]